MSHFIVPLAIIIAAILVDVFNKKEPKDQSSYSDYLKSKQK